MVASGDTDDRLVSLVSAFGKECAAALAGPGEREEAIRIPIVHLLQGHGTAMRITVTPHGETHLTDRSVRPDYAISVDGAVTGYVEIKAPSVSVDPATFRGHNKRQWERLRDLPNLLYTNGTTWTLYRDGEALHGPLHLDGGPLGSSASLASPGDAFERLLTDFLRWKPAPITSVGALVRAVAPLTRLLRGEVLEQLEDERRAVRDGADELAQPFSGLARDWRALLFPTADDAVFADGYAQAVTFALLLARSDGIDVANVSLHEIGDRLGDHHSLMGRALQLLTDNASGEFTVTLDLLRRVVGAVNWERVRSGKRDTYLHLYERFLEDYDPELRKQSGSYYTPREVVEQMVRLTEEALMTRLDRPRGFLDRDVVTVDPAMGTGTYLHTIIERAAKRVAETEGKGLVPGTITDLAAHLVGFELQMGPYAVAELRAADLLRDRAAAMPAGGMRLFVTNTLDDPDAVQTQLASGLATISKQRRDADAIKRSTPVTVVIGNPPYRERAEGMGGWVENGPRATHRIKSKAKPILDDFRLRDNGLSEYVLKNLYVYFWRWATWKVFDAEPGSHTGAVCFISTSGYLRGPGFKGMREYLRRTCSEGWIIDVTPEGMQPDVATRVFPGVQQPLAIGLFVRGEGTTTDMPARVRYVSVHGRQSAKFRALAELDLDGAMWRETRTTWTAPFTPAPTGAWDDFPALSDLMPWTSPGIKPNRTWIYAPDTAVLERRWRALATEPDRDRRAELFKSTRDSSLTKGKVPLEGAATASPSLMQAMDDTPKTARVGYRSFDRQWVISDSRVMDTARPDLWAAHAPGQVYVVEQHSKPISEGPGLVFSALIPDMDHFKGSEGGRVLPLRHPDGQPNLAPGLLDALGRHLEDAVSAEDLLAYVAAVVSHPGFTDLFEDELTTPGVRVPLTSERALWDRAVAIGRQVVWLHTYGSSFADDANGRPLDSVRYERGDERQPLNTAAVADMPEVLSYDAETREVRLGAGSWGPVDQSVFDYAVGGKNVIKSWFNYRKRIPGGKKTSPLDHINVEEWPTDWSVELTDLLTVLTRLVVLEPDQAELLERVMAGPLMTITELAEHGVRWPTLKADRKPRYSVVSTPDTLVFGGEPDASE